jgi:hypothetical protein
MTRWTGFVIAHRKRILAAWAVLFLLGGYAAGHLGGLLSNRFSVPGAESERGLDLLKDRMHDRSDGAFTLVATGVTSPAARAAVGAAAARAATRAARPARCCRPGRARSTPRSPRRWRTRRPRSSRRGCAARSATSRRRALT